MILSSRLGQLPSDLTAVKSNVVDLRPKSNEARLPEANTLLLLVQLILAEDRKHIETHKLAFGEEVLEGGLEKTSVRLKHYLTQRGKRTINLF